MTKLSIQRENFATGFITFQILRLSELKIFRQLAKTERRKPLGPAGLLRARLLLDGRLHVLLKAVQAVRPPGLGPQEERETAPRCRNSVWGEDARWPLLSVRWDWSGGLWGKGTLCPENVLRPVHPAGASVFRVPSQTEGPQVTPRWGQISVGGMKHSTAHHEGGHWRQHPNGGSSSGGKGPGPPRRAIE